MADTWLDLITDALLDLGVFAPSDPIDQDSIDVCVRWLNRTIDSWQALKRYAYNVNFTQYTLTPGRQPHQIGPTAVAPDWTVAQRPVRIEGAALVLTTSSPPVDSPVLNIRDDDWWLNKRVKSLSSSVPTDLYPSYDHPNVSLYFWPVPSFAYGLRLETWVSMQQIPLDINGKPDLLATFSAPQGYYEALMLTLEEKVARIFGKPLSADLLRAASRARAAIQSNNAKSPRISTADHGTASLRGGFNWKIGGPA